MRRCEKVFEKMRRTKDGWKPQDFEVLYIGFGFVQSQSRRHTKYQHPQHPELWTMVSRSEPLSRAYAHDAIELIDTLQRLER